MPRRLSAIDIGSNAIRMIIGEVDSQRIQVLRKYRVPLRLGQDTFTTGNVSEAALQKAEEAFQEFARLNKKFAVADCRAVATSALREAKNKNAFVQRIKTASQIKIEVIDGFEEGQLIFNAVNREVLLTNRNAVLIDVGGGSVEVTIVSNEKIIATQSFPLGTVRLLENLRKRQLGEDQLNVVLGDFVGPLVSYLESSAVDQSYDFAVGTGGNLEAMARLKTQLLSKATNSYVSLSELVEITKILRQYSIKDRIELLKLRPDRADVIIPATMVVKTILRQAGIEKILIPGVGLRDGILLSMVTNSSFA